MRTLEPERLAPSGRERSAEESSQTDAQQPKITCGDARSHSMVLSEGFMTKKGEEEPRKASLFTQTTLLFQQNEELTAWNEALREEDEVCAETAAETSRDNLGDENGQTGLELMRFSLEEEGSPN